MDKRGKRMKLKRVLFMILFCLGLASCDFVVEPKGAEKIL